jgi:UDP:flavonoid glycosyltransferase YjiC (YdhE family)
MSRLLFASMPFDGHFNPLTGLAVHLKGRGHDVRFYCAPSYAEKLARLGIPHLPFVRAREVNAQNLTQVFPEYENLRVGPKLIEVTLRQIFFGNLEAHYRDICELRANGFEFDALISDGALYASRLVAEKLQPRVYAVYPAPTPAPTSKSAPPPFFGLKPSRSIFGRLRDHFVAALLERTNAKSMSILNDLRAREGLPPYRESLWDIHVETARAIFQIGVPGLDFPREDWPANFRFVGALVPHRAPGGHVPLGHGIDERLARYQTLIVVSQGTVDNRDPEKLFVPALEALKGGPHLVVATTGHRHTEALSKRFPQDNIVIADWIDFHALLEQADLFICNGGYGSVMLSLSNGVPLLSAGKLEGKNDVNARVDYRQLGHDLGTERPTPRQIATGVRRIFADPRYRENAARLQAELASYDAFAIIEAKLREDGL